MIISAKNVTTAFGEKIIHDSVNFGIKEGEIYGFLGGSGSGKTTLMKTLIYLKEPISGEELMFGENLWRANGAKREEIKLKTSVMFQFGALFSSINVLENVGILLKEYSKFSRKEIDEIAMFWIQKVGLKAESANLMPSELSGGMKKRVALARALVLSPKILFLDEPNSGLDPISSRNMDKLITEIRDSLGITIVMVTHDADTIFDILDRFLIIDNKKIAYEGDISGAMRLENNPLKALFEMRNHSGK